MDTGFEKTNPMREKSPVKRPFARLLLRKLSFRLQDFQL